MLAETTDDSQVYGCIGLAATHLHIEVGCDIVLDSVMHTIRDW